LQQQENELLLIKHCQNLQQLSVKQLHALKEDKLDLVNELATQKQIIIDSIAALQVKFDIKYCQLEFKEKMKMLLNQIDECENQSQQIVREHCASIGKEMLANRKELNIQQSYEEGSYQESGNMLNIRK